MSLSMYALLGATSLRKIGGRRGVPVWRAGAAELGLAAGTHVSCRIARRASGGTFCYTFAVMLWFLVCARLLYLIVWDQRYRCRVCLRRLRMPIDTGSWSRMLLFGRPRIEYICLYGHGTLREDEFVGSPNGPEWNGLRIPTISGTSSAPPARNPAIRRESRPPVAYRGSHGRPGDPGRVFGVCLPRSIITTSSCNAMWQKLHKTCENQAQPDDRIRRLVCRIEPRELDLPVKADNVHIIHSQTEAANRCALLCPGQLSGLYGGSALSIPARVMPPVSSAGAVR